MVSGSVLSSVGARSRSRSSRATPPSEGDAPCALTHEWINAELLVDVASRRASASLKLPGCDLSLREILYWFLACAEGSGALRRLTVVWREEKSLGFGVPRPKGRRYSGFAPWAGSAVALPGLERLSRLVANGVPAFFVGKSLFAMPKLVRHLARAGLCGVDLDQDNAHPRATLKRHLGAAPLLAGYVRDREAMLEATCTATGVTRDDAKQLFLQLLYAGGVASWCDAHGVDMARLPSFFREFEEEQAELRLRDVGREPELLRACKASGHHRPDVLLQSVLNCAAERLTLDVMEARLEGTAGSVASYEHDGLWVMCRTKEELALVTQRLCAPGAAGDVPVKAKPVPSPDEAWVALRAAHPSQLWDVKEDADVFAKQMGAVQKARAASAQGLSEDLLYAHVVAEESEAYAGRPWSVRQLFKFSGNRDFAWFDVATCTWMPAGCGGRNELLHVIADVLGRRCGEVVESEQQEVCDTVSERRWGVAKRDQSCRGFGHAPLLERVESLLRALLTDPAFDLDGEDARRYLVFQNAAFDVEEMRWVPLSPEIRTTHCTGWSWHGSGLSEDAEQRLEEALRAWRLAEELQAAEAKAGPRRLWPGFVQGQGVAEAAEQQLPLDLHDASGVCASGVAVMTCRCGHDRAACGACGQGWAQQELKKMGQPGAFGQTPLAQTPPVAL